MSDKSVPKDFLHKQMTKQAQNEASEQMINYPLVSINETPPIILFYTKLPE